MSKNRMIVAVQLPPGYGTHKIELQFAATVCGASLSGNSVMLICLVDCQPGIKIPEKEERVFVVAPNGHAVSDIHKYISTLETKEEVEIPRGMIVPPNANGLKAIKTTWIHVFEQVMPRDNNRSDDHGTVSDGQCIPSSARTIDGDGNPRG